MGTDLFTWERIYSHGNTIIKILQHLSAHLTCLLHCHRLGQVPGLIYVAAPCYGGVVGEQLQGDGCQQGAEGLQCLRDVEVVVGVLANVLVAFGGDDYDVGVAGTDLLDVADDFFVDVRGRGYSDEGGVRVEQGDGAVLEFTGWKSLGVDVGDFFELEGTLKGCGVAYAAADKDHAGAVGHALCQGGDEIVGTGGMVQHLLDLVGDTLQGCEQLLGLFSGHVAALLSEPEGQEVEDGERADEGLGGHDSDLWAGLQVEDGIGQAGDGAGHDVGNGDDGCASLACLANTYERVRRLTGLGHGDT